jgi:probable HAF family extracellular repeat protein
MKFKAISLAVVAVLAIISAPAWLSAQDNAKQHPHPKHHQYKVVDLGTFGGPFSTVVGFSHSLTARGEVVGGADTAAANPNPGCANSVLGTPDCNVNHAFQWRHGTLTDLGALPGAVNSFAQGANENGWVVGASENGVTDPVLGIPEFNAILWRNGQIKDLGTLGGNESVALDASERGRIVGFSANAVPDPASMFGFATQTRPFLYERGVMRDLDTLGGTDGAAFLTNERGQITGQFYVQGTTTIDSIFWDEDGTATDIGSLGGTNSNCMQQACGPYWINNRGQVVGNSTLAGEAVHHGFLWDRGTLTDLGTLGGDSSDANSINDSGVAVGRADVPGSLTHHGILWTPRHGVMTATDLGVIGGDACSTAYSINSGGQIVGDAGICFVGGRAWLWEDGGPMVDLNTLALPGSGLHLQDARLINDRGEIVCTGVLPGGNLHAVLLIPVDEDESAARVPVPTLAPGPTPAAQLALPLRPATDYLAAERIGAARGRGYCTANSTGLTGGCVGYRNANFCSVRTSTACPRGLKAIKPAYYRCSLMQKDYVDLGRSCSY